MDAKLGKISEDLNLLADLSKSKTSLEHLWNSYPEIIITFVLLMLLGFFLDCFSGKKRLFDYLYRFFLVSFFFSLAFFFDQKLSVSYSEIRIETLSQGIKYLTGDKKLPSIEFINMLIAFYVGIFVWVLKVSFDIYKKCEEISNFLLFVGIHLFFSIYIFSAGIYFINLDLVYFEKLPITEYISYVIDGLMIIVTFTALGIIFFKGFYKCLIK